MKKIVFLCVTGFIMSLITLICILSYPKYPDLIEEYKKLKDSIENIHKTHQRKLEREQEKKINQIRRIYNQQRERDDRLVCNTNIYAYLKDKENKAPIKRTYKFYGAINFSNDKKNYGEGFLFLPEMPEEVLTTYVYKDLNGEYEAYAYDFYFNIYFE